MPTPPLPSGAGLSRRTLLGGIGAAGAALLLAGCAPSGSGRGRTEITFYATKPEAIPYFSDLVSRFNESQSAIRVIHDSTSGISAPSRPYAML